jgi:hypothetical protein
MKSSTAKSLALVLLAGFIASAAALAEDIPLQNWTVPPYHRMGASGGLTTMGGGGDVTPAVPFVGYAPCRLVDTRTTTIPNFPAGYGPPALAAGSPRNFDLNNQPNCVGIPAGVEAYSLNITVTNTLGPGFILIYPQGGAQPPVSTLNYLAGQTVANAAIVPAGTGGGVTVIAGVSGTDLIIDINGYFSDSGNLNTEFVWVTNDVTESMFVQNTSTTGGLVIEANSIATTDGFGAIFADSDAATGRVFGVWGDIDSPDVNAAGVLGWGAGNGVSAAASYPRAGVRGEDAGTGIGVLGITETDDGFHAGVVGAVLNAGLATEAASGYIGARVCPFGCATLAGYFVGNVSVLGNLSASGMKPFIEPTAADPMKMIQYIALEGPEAGTYFRGRSRFSRGLARIEVPAHFRETTDSEGLSVQITPIGEMATVAVLKADLNEIVVKSSRNVEFYYTVNGIRRAYKDVGVYQDSMFLPLSAGAKMPAQFPDEIRSRLISAGVYNADGTVNMETMERIGLTRLWRESAEQEVAARTQAARTEP